MRVGVIAPFVARGDDEFPTWQAVRTNDWKYIEYSGVENMNELYNLKNDPGEMKNLINDPAAAGKLKDLKAELARLRDETK